jgi:hypothetical protein
MNSTAIKWAADFRYNEPLHEGARTIYTTYGRLGIKYPDHADYALWEKLEKKWIEYERNISDLPLSTQEQAQAEVNRVLDLAKETLKLEDTLQNQPEALKKKH